MSMDNVDREAVGGGSCDSAPKPSRCCCCGRKWCWCVPLALIVLGGGVVYWLLFTRVYRLDVYQTAMQKIEADEGLRRELGQPIQTVGWRPPSARVEETEKDVRWNIAGPKGDAKAHVFARLRQDKWELIQLEVVLAGGKRVSITDLGDGAAEAPRFTGPKPETKKPDANAPAPQIDLQVPSIDGPEKP